jgi:hypothetical protein
MAEYMKTDFKETGYCVWTEYIWLRAETTDVSFEHSNEIMGSITHGEFIV